MMISMETALRKLRRQAERWSLHPRVRRWTEVLLWAGAGLVLSAANLGNAPQPFAAALGGSLGRWRMVPACLGAMGGYRLFWGREGLPGVIWTLGAVGLGLLPGKSRDSPFFCAVVFSAFTAVTGLGFFLISGEIRYVSYVLQVTMAALGAALFAPGTNCREGIRGWGLAGLCLLALGGLTELAWCSPAFLALGYLTAAGTFPAAVLGGLALDLARITTIPMGAVAALGWLLRLAPVPDRRMRMMAPALAQLGVMLLWGELRPEPLPGLLLGGVLGYYLPVRLPGKLRRGDTGAAQVRLEMTASVLTQVQQLLLETPEGAFDGEALLEKVKSRVCDRCSARNVCRDRNRLRLRHLQKPEEFSCRKPLALRQELRHQQERLRLWKADCSRRREYRFALIQQYQFLAEYLRRLADGLPGKELRPRGRFRLELSVRSASRESTNGDRCLTFPGGGCRYYLLLCDGMGTGLGAAREGQTAAEILRGLLEGGFPAEYACRSLNSLLVLRGQAGAVTVDLAEFRLDTGRITLYKWGASPSWVLRRTGAEKIGTATAPPGISVRETREATLRLSLGRGEALILLSDGAEAGEFLRSMEFSPDAPPGELADKLLEAGRGEDDATVAVAKLHPRLPWTS